MFSKASFGGQISLDFQRESRYLVCVDPTMKSLGTLAGDRRLSLEPSCSQSGCPKVGRVQYGPASVLLPLDQAGLASVNRWASVLLTGRESVTPEVMACNPCHHPPGSLSLLGFTLCGPESSQSEWFVFVCVLERGYVSIYGGWGDVCSCVCF